MLALLRASVGYRGHRAHVCTSLRPLPASMSCVSTRARPGKRQGAIREQYCSADRALRGASHCRPRGDRRCHEGHVLACDVTGRGPGSSLPSARWVREHVVLDLVTKYAVHSRRVHHEHVIKGLSDPTDDPLNVSVLPRRSRRRKNGLIRKERICA